MEWKIINESYLDFLRSYETRIPKTDYGNDKMKPFFGVLFQKGNDIVYVTQISSPKQRHEKMKNTLDFKKVYEKSKIKDKDRLIGVINLNYMFPVPYKMMKDLDYKTIGELRTFNDEVSKSKYIDLLKTEIKIINELNLSKSAENLYKLKHDFPADRVSQRCFDFKDLEKKCDESIKSSSCN
jgi:protein AbiQ